MPKYLVTQCRDAIQYFIALIDADSIDDAHDKASDDKCAWIENGTHQLDDRDIPKDQIIEVANDHVLPHPRVQTVVWLLKIDTADDSPTAHIYEDEKEALQAFGAALSEYMSDKERSLYASDPRGAYQAILDREGGDFPNGHKIELEEHRLSVTPLTQPSRERPPT